MRRLSWEQFDFILLGLVATLVIFGIAVIRSAIAGNEVLAGLVQRQITFAIIGFVVVLITAAIDYHYWATLGKYLYVATVLLLAALGIIGKAAFGSARWIDTGFFFIQPSEIAKIVMILVLADFFARHREQLHEFRWVVMSFLLTMGMVIWILLQPDLSTSITVLVIWFGMLWAAGLTWKHLAIFAVLGAISPFAAWPFLADYQKARVINFLFPDPNARHGAIYNVQQALISLGSGGLFGQGYGHGTQVQLRFLKVRHTDFIFSVIGEEFGFVGTVFVIVMLALVLWRILRIARTAHDTFGALIAYGIAIMLFFHMAVNIAMNINLIPVTGLPLPFITYGGSALLSSLLGIGLVESVAMRREPLSF
ncbi:MAG: rod shape-determining protein RodA [Chloroflexi bacterium]|nr:rod shape-determining protein RodA [Chloroflexota bacterium]